MDPRSAVVFGVSAKGHNPGRIILENLRRSPSVAADRLYVVHPTQSEIAGVPCFTDIASLPERCDLAVIALPAAEAVATVAELVDHDRAAAIILNPGGFAEAGRADLAVAIETALARGQARPGRRTGARGGQLPGHRQPGMLQHLLPARIQAAVPPRSWREPGSGQPVGRLSGHVHQQFRRGDRAVRVHQFRQPDGPDGQRFPGALSGRTGRRTSSRAMWKVSAMATACGSWSRRAWRGGEGCAW